MDTPAKRANKPETVLDGMDIREEIERGIVAGCMIWEVGRLVG